MKVASKRNVIIDALSRVVHLIWPINIFQGVQQIDFAVKLSPAESPVVHHVQRKEEEAKGMSLINNIFDGTNYGNWKRGVLISLSPKNKVSFINGTCKPPRKDSTMFAQWIHCNDMVLSWLLNSLSREIAESVIYSSAVVDLWNELEERYGQVDGTKLFHLQRELNIITQGSSDVASYFTKLKRI
ncbi:uncharacterized protein LOC107879501 [Capsicum annuum]|uniref:uncharacterized protein LOC107879501 n=1 Tax=Capsicum annuum TaxID=4072 RepID=UPI0007BF6E4F|nr:uncharacterized protein LOC107879501 [Capsicum annuum]